MFKNADKIVKHQSWYNSYKANIVAYTLSILIYKVQANYPDLSIPYHDIWAKQSLNDAWIKQIEKTSRVIYEFLISDTRKVENVTEWAKRELCWDFAKELNIELQDDFLSTLQSKEDQKLIKKDNKKDQKLENDLNQTIEVYNYGAENWKYLAEWNNSHGVLNVQELSFLKLAINFERKMPSDKQCARIMQVLKHAREEGYPK